MSKPFITYTAQIEKLKSEKNLIIAYFRQIRKTGFKSEAECSL